MNVVLFGFKGCGKTFVGRALAARLGLAFVDTDKVLEEAYFESKGKRLSFREIAKKHGMTFFRLLEKRAVQKAAILDEKVIACGGGTPLSPGNVAALKRNGRLVLLTLAKETLLERILAEGMPAFFDEKNPNASFEKIFNERARYFEEIADLKIDCDGKSSMQVMEEIVEKLGKP